MVCARISVGVGVFALHISVNHREQYTSIQHLRNFESFLQSRVPGQSFRIFDSQAPVIQTLLRPQIRFVLLISSCSLPWRSIRD